MTIYSGNKSVDAEITIDFDENTVEMDYTLNKFGSPTNSNRTVVIKNDLLKLPFKERLAVNLRRAIGVSFIFFYSLPYSVLTRAMRHGYLKNYQLAHQQIQKEIQQAMGGIARVEVKGPFEFLQFRHHIYSNLWFKYQLEGDYETQIQKIEFKRNFVRETIYGDYERIRQYGWNLIFTFRNPPKDGRCLVEYV